MTHHQKHKKGTVEERTLTEINPYALEESLQGLDFPADKDEILRKAEENNAPDDIYFALDQLEDRNYSDLEEILHEFR